jgi:hypothetical protein
VQTRLKMPITVGKAGEVQRCERTGGRMGNPHDRLRGVRPTLDSPAASLRADGDAAVGFGVSAGAVAPAGSGVTVAGQRAREWAMISSGSLVTGGSGRVRPEIQACGVPTRVRRA